MNPYAKYLGDRHPIVVLAETPARVTQLVERLGTGAFSRTYAEGKWPVEKILTHLVHCEIGFSQRIRQALVVPNYTAQPFDQDDWMASETTMDGELALATFFNLRKFDLLLFQALTAAQKATPLTNPELGAQSIGLLLEIMAGHDLNHLEQLAAIPVI
jgi:hypothetical protein